MNTSRPASFSKAAISLIQNRTPLLFTLPVGLCLSKDWDNPVDSLSPTAISEFAHVLHKGQTVPYKRRGRGFHPQYLNFDHRKVPYG